MLEVLAPVSSVPRPRLHLIRFHGVLAPNAKLRSKIVPNPAECARETSSEDAHAPPRAPARMSWARLLKRGLRHRHRTLPNCGSALKIIDAPSTHSGVEDPPVIVKILSHLGLPTRVPPRAPARRVALFQTIRGAENRLPTRADGAARSEFDRPARSPVPRAPAISAPPPTLPSKIPTRPQLLLNSAALDRLYLR